MVDFEPGRMTRSASRGSGAPGATKTSFDAGLDAERIEIVEIGDARQHRHGDLDAVAMLAVVPRSRSTTSSAGSRPPAAKGHDAERRPAGAPRDRRSAIVEQRGVAAELVDQESLDPRRFAPARRTVRADEAGDDAAAVDVADQDHRHVGGLGEAHIGDVAGAQIDLRRAARAFDEDKVGVARRLREALQHAGSSSRLARPILARPHACRDAAPAR